MAVCGLVSFSLFHVTGALESLIIPPVIVCLFVSQIIETTTIYPLLGLVLDLIYGQGCFTLSCCQVLFKSVYAHTMFFHLVSMGCSFVLSSMLIDVPVLEALIGRHTVRPCMTHRYHCLRR